MSEHASPASPAPELVPNPVGEALYAELLWVHDSLRRDLEVVTRLAADILSGLPPARVQDAVAALETRTPLWQLKANCLTYCRFVHGHHGLEDVALFPALRRTNPALGPEVDKLEADHRVVARLLEEIEEATRALGRQDTPAARARLNAALSALSEHLLTHLSYEEQVVAATMRSWTARPVG